MKEHKKTVVAVTGSFDDIRSGQIRFLHEASRLGAVHLYLWPDVMVRACEQREPRFPAAERGYFTGAIRYVERVILPAGPFAVEGLPATDGAAPRIWVVTEEQDSAARRAYCAAHGMEYRVLRKAELTGFDSEPAPLPAGSAPRKKVIVTGCYDWFHSGHVRFFEEVSALGDLYVALGNDANVEQLKGRGHPLFPQDERRYVVQSIRYVAQAVISTGFGWLDAEPEIRLIRPDIYAVNEDGDKPEKREFCLKNGIEYVVLKRLPKAGLPRRASTDLRGF